MLPAYARLFRRGYTDFLCRFVQGYTNHVVDLDDLCFTCTNTLLLYSVPVDTAPIKLTSQNRLRLPFYGTLVPAGFPSPATSYIESVCDLNELCIDNPEATYFVRATGDSMSGDHIFPGDILIVDASLTDYEERIIIAWHNGAFTVKRLHMAPPLVVLEPSNEAYAPLYVQPEDDFKIFGVVTFVFQDKRRRR